MRVMMSWCLAIAVFLGTAALASAKDASTCETLADALSGAEKYSFLDKCEQAFRTGHVCMALKKCCKDGSQNCCDTARIERCSP